MATIGKLLVELGLEDADFRGGIAGATAALEGMQSAGSKFAGVMDGVVAGAVAAAGGALAAFGYQTIQTGADFETAFKKVGALAGATVPEMQALEDKARELGAATKYSATESALAMQELAAAGLTPGQIMTATGPALLLAAAAGTDLATSTSLMAATFAQFNLNASEAGRVADVFSTAMNGSLLDVSSLTEAMKYAGTAGAGFGYSLEQTTASVALFRDLGLEGSMAGTNFRSALEAVADVSDKAAKALGKYGLTVADVSPETNSFAEIMQKVGDASISTTDAITIFGSRSGANVAQISRSFAEGTTNYYKLLSAMETSTGSTQDLYNTMTDTVLARMEQVSGSAEELMLSVFDQFKGPLAGLLDQLAQTIAYVAQEFGRLSGAGSDFGSIIEQATDYLAKNKEAIAIGFSNLLTTLVDVTAAFVSMIPTLITLGKAMATIWVANRVRIFVVAVQSAITALGAMGGGIRAVTLALTAATGGVYAAVAAIGTIVAGIIYFVSTANSAEEAANRLRVAQEKMAVEAQAVADAQDAAASAIAKTQAENIGELQLELETRNQLSGGIDQQLSRLQSLDAASVKAGVEQGTLFAGMLNGKEVVLDAATAMSLAVQETSLSADAQTSLANAIGKATAENEKAKGELAAITDAQEKYTRMTRDGIGVNKFYAEYLEKYGANMDEVTERQRMYEARVRSTQQALDGMNGAVVEAANAIDLADKRAGKSTAIKLENDKADAAKKASDNIARAYEARLKAVERVEAAIAKRAVQTKDEVAYALQEQLAELNRVFDAEVKAYGRQTKKIAAAEAERARVVATVRADAILQQQQSEQSLVDGYLRDTAVTQMSDQQREAATLQKSIDDRRKALELEFQQELALYEKGSAERIDVLLRFFSARTKLEQLEAAEQLARTQKSYAEIDRTIEQMQLGQAQERMNELQRIELERLQALVAAEGATAQQRAEINAVFDARILAQKSKLTDEIVLLTAGGNRRVLELERERDAMLAQLGDDQTDERQKVIDHYAAAIDEANAEAEESTVDASEQMANALRAVGDAAMAVAKAIASGIGKAINGVVGLFADLTGFSFDLLGAVSEVNSAMGEAADLKAQLAAGDISPEEYTKQMASLPSSLASAAEQYVTDLVASASQMLTAFVEAAPALVAALGEQLPALIDQFAAALPAVTKGLADAIGPLIEALVQAVPQVAQALADSIGVVIDALVAGLPGLVSSLLDAIVQLLPMLGNMITQLLDIVPWLVQSVLQALPTIIQSLIGALGTIIMALVDAVIMLVQVVIQQLPTIIMALVSGVLELVQVLLAAIPKLVIGIVQQLPALVQALLSAVTMLVQELVAQLPTIINALLVAVTDIIVAVAEMLPDLLTSIIEMLPTLIMSIVQLIPALIEGVVSAIPYIITALINSVPVIIKALFTELLPAIFTSIPEIIGGLFKAIFYEIPLAIGELMAQLGMALWKLIGEGIDALGQFFSDVIDEIVSLGTTDTQTFGDTPGAVRAGADGMAARFAPGDYIVAAQNPAVLLQQALDAMRAEMSGGVAPAARGYAPGEMEVPAAAGLAQAMLQAASAMNAGNAAGGGTMQSAPMKVVVQANGRVLDEVLFAAGRRGEAPRLAGELKRSTLRAGVHVGFDRGKF